MAGFNAGSSIEPLHYDFTTVEGGEGKGTIPEPSQEQIEAFVSNFQALVSDLQSRTNGEASGEDVDEAMSHIRELRKHSTQYVSELCSGTPSIEEIESLPPRLQTAFTKWVRQEITDPNVRGGGTGR